MGRCRSLGAVWGEDSTNYTVFKSMDTYMNEERAWGNQDGLMEWDPGVNDNALTDVQSGGYDNVKEIIDGQFPALGSFDVKSDTELVATEIQHLRLGGTDKDAEVPVYDDLGVPVIDRDAMIPDLNVLLPFKVGLGIWEFCAISRRLISKIRFPHPISVADAICGTRFDLRDSKRRALEN